MIYAEALIASVELEPLESLDILGILENTSSPNILGSNRRPEEVEKEVKASALVKSEILK